MSLKQARFLRAARRVVLRRWLSALPVCGVLALASVASAQPADVRPPEVVERVDADYPQTELDAKHEGQVVLFVTVGTDGLVMDAVIEKSAGEDLDKAALNAIKRWRFTPATKGGQPIAAKIRVPFDFKLPKPAGSPPAGTPARPAADATPSKGASPPKKKAEPPHTPDDGHDHATFQDDGEIIVVGRARAPQRGASDINIRLGALGKAPRGNAAELLKLAPGILLSNEGGDGHAQQVFLRGFDAREGQDIEFSVDGVPINQVGNIHGNGYADTNFIIPELVEELRVLEGPFEPQQGNFAVAGSADYRLGLDQRGLTMKYMAGSFNTQRLLLLWGPAHESHHTFGGAELYDTDGFGQGRASRRGSAIGQYEWRIGRTGLWRVTGQAYSVDYKSAGVLRADDYYAGRKRFYDTYDDWQGGQATRFSISSAVEQKAGDTLFKQQVFVVDGSMRLQENFTGFLLDTQQPLQDPHTQRGDRIDKNIDTTTIGARGSARWSGKALGQKQEFELGYLARGDRAEGLQERVQASNGVPYAKDLDLESKTANVGVYADAAVKPIGWFTLKGGVRGELFTYDVLNRCAVNDVRFPAGAGFDGDTGCFSQQPAGEYRLPTQRTTTSGSTVLPRAVALFGPFEGFAMSVGWGRGVRAIDPQFVNQDGQAPFSGITAYEGGVMYAHQLGDVALVARSIFFQTEVEQDYLFSQTAGRNTLANGTTRTGWVGAVRATGDFFDVNTNLTLVRSTFDDTALAIPYVPSAVARADAAFFGDLPIEFGGSALKATSSLGATYVAPRPLPYDELSDSIFTLDAAASVGWKSLEFGVHVSNLLDRQYRLGEYNYPSDFHTEPTPTLVPERHFTAGPPRAVYATFAVHLGED
ncbi:MAG: TonB family protein [Polyangiaceae bacterium]|nr:TonB family protein [Polyangiaceae bacterium]